MRKIFHYALILSFFVPSAFADEKSEYRNRIRAWVISHAAKPIQTIEPQGNDLAAEFVDELRYVNLAGMEKAGLLTSRLETKPWSGSYWPTYAGSIANRYTDPSFQTSDNWKENARYLESAVGKGDMDVLSPAEKYDLLIGDSSFSLTNRMIQDGAPYAKRDGTVPTWFGICHGWAPASFMEPRPGHSVKVKAADGREITFTPTDLKALTTLLWANGAGETRFIGGRCNDATPARDHNNREKDSDCFDTNPATWHLSVVNQIGVSNRSFVLDVSPAAEVWNQPAIGYKYVYVNPITGATGKTLSEAKVKLADWRKDPFSDTRSAKAVYVVKITMAFEYGSETQPLPAYDDSVENDAHASQKYIYDLELDEKDNIVGGEWHSTVHPDFLWVPVAGTKAYSAGDVALDRQGDRASWSADSVLPKSWRSAALISSANEQPLARVVEKLFELSQEAQ